MLVGPAALMVVKGFIWAIALGSGTSGGVLAPLLIIGGALGAVARSCPAAMPALWPLVGMAAIMGGTMRVAADGRAVRPGADPRCQDPARAPDRLGDGLRPHGPGDEALDPDREGRPAGLPHPAASTASIRSSASVSSR